jgi:hypothetical protein
MLMNLFTTIEKLPWAWFYLCMALFWVAKPWVGEESDIHYLSSTPAAKLKQVHPKLNVNVWLS